MGHPLVETCQYGQILRNRLQNRFAHGIKGNIDGTPASMYYAGYIVEVSDKFNLKNPIRPTITHATAGQVLTRKVSIEFGGRYGDPVTVVTNDWARVQPTPPCIHR